MRPATLFALAVAPVFLATSTRKVTPGPQVATSLLVPQVYLGSMNDWVSNSARRVVRGSAH